MPAFPKYTFITPSRGWQRVAVGDILAYPHGSNAPIVPTVGDYIQDVT